MTVAKKTVAKKAPTKAKAPAPNFAVGQKLVEKSAPATIVGKTTSGEWIVETDGYTSLESYSPEYLASAFIIVG